MKTIKSFFQDSKAFFREYPEHVVAILLLVVLCVLLFIFVSLPNFQECSAHGFSLRFCLTAIG